MADLHSTFSQLGKSKLRNGCGLLVPIASTGISASKNTWTLIGFRIRISLASSMLALLTAVLIKSKYFAPEQKASSTPLQLVEITNAWSGGRNELMLFGSVTDFATGALFMSASAFTLSPALAKLASRMRYMKWKVEISLL